MLFGERGQADRYFSERALLQGRKGRSGLVLREI
jgi:hypothetical protein